MGIVKNWMTLKRWIEKEGFPPGKKLAAKHQSLPRRWGYGVAGDSPCGQ